MRRILLAAVVVSALLVVPFLVSADIENPGHIIKWSQIPPNLAPLVDPETWGPHNLRSWYSVGTSANPNIAVWDDWLCTQTGTIDDLHWWGGIPGDQASPQNGQPDYFNVVFWTSYYPPAGATPTFSRPLLWKKTITVPIAQVEIQPKVLIDHQAAGAPWEYIYQYYVDFTKVPGVTLFTQQGTAANPIPYFMGIQAGWNTPSQQGWWGWTEAMNGVADAEWERVGGPGAVALNDDAVRGTYQGGTPPWLWEEIGGVRLGSTGFTSLDMAFELSQNEGGPPIPEPGTMVLLGLGLFGLGAKLRRRRA